MTKRLAALFVALTLTLAAPGWGDDPEPPGPKAEAREISSKAGLPDGGRYDAPVRVKTKKQLADLVGNERTEAAIRKRVDFRKEHLLVFWWLGPADDRLSWEGKSGTLTFTYQAGETPGRFRHAKLFVIPARVKSKVVVK